MGIIDDEDRTARRKAEEAKAAAEAKRVRQEIKRFLSKENLDRLTVAIVGEAKRLFAALGEVERLYIKTDGITHVISEDEKCRDALMKALLRVEPNTQRLGFQKPSEDDMHQLWTITVWFNPPLT